MKTKDLREIMTMAHRFIKIAGITLSEALKRAWANFKLVKAMKNRIVKFYFQKVDGSIREAYGTLKESYLSASTRTDRKRNDITQVFFDTEKQEWRCFKKMNIVY